MNFCGRFVDEFRCRSVAAAGDRLSFASPKESRQGKGELKSGGLLGSDANFAAVRSTTPCGRAKGSANLDSDPKNPSSRQAGSSSNSLRCTSLKQSLALIRPPLRCSALPHGVGDRVGRGCGRGIGIGIGRFRGQSPNSPRRWRALRVLRSEIAI